MNGRGIEKSGDPLATPISAISARPQQPSQLPSMNVGRQSKIVEKPNYAQLVKEMESAEPSGISEFEDSPLQHSPVQPVHEESPAPEIEHQYPAPRFVQPPPPAYVPIQPPQETVRETAEKPKLSPIEANKNLIILAVVVAAVLKFAAPRLRAYPKFLSNSELGLNLPGIFAVSIIIVALYKLITHLSDHKA